MPRNKIEDLRNHLFEAIEKLQEGEMQLDTAKAINDISKTIVASAKVEVQFLKVLKREAGTGFIPLGEGTE
jgi:hypothetical protein